jgi:hypothetical protein
MSDKNPFGGANVNSLYVPLSETEQEVLSRLVEADDLEVVIHGWGILHRPQILFGDLRVSIMFRLDFNAPAVPQPVHYFDLELRTRAGMTLFKERQPTVYGGKPLQVAAGVSVDLAWDIALHHIDPKIVKAIKPGAVGLTSRRLDKETGEPTFKGNMDLSGAQKKLLRIMREGEDRVRKDDAKKVLRATQDAGDEIKVTSKGLEVKEPR